MKSWILILRTPKSLMRRLLVFIRYLMSHLNPVMSMVILMMTLILVNLGVFWINGWMRIRYFDLASNSPNVADVGDCSDSHIDKENSNIPNVELEEGTVNVKSCEISTDSVSVVEPPVSVINNTEVGTTMPSSSFKPSTSASKSANPFSKVGVIVDSDSDSEDEVLNIHDESANLFDMPMGTFSSSGGGGDYEDYYDYDDYTDLIYDLPGQVRALYEDIKLQGRRSN